MMRLLLALATVMVGCAHGDSHGPTKVASAQPRTHARAVELAPTTDECDSLFLHAIDVIATPDVTDADKKDQAIAALHDDFVHGCLALSRSTLRCASAAVTVEEMLACDHATRSSSTSNSSVAPGGMSPPAAPRAP